MPTKLTTDIFIEKAKRLHGDKYDYSKSVYVTGHSPITVICRVHGEYTCSALMHISKTKCSGCPKCWAERIPYILRKPLTDWVNKWRSKHGDTYDYSQVKEGFNQLDKINIVCKQHGLFYQTAKDHTKYGCRKCANEKLSKKYSSTTDEFVSKMQDRHGDKYDYSKIVYTKSDVPVEFICDKHGSFFSIPDNVLQGSGCPKCCSNYSKIEEDISNYIESKSIKVVLNDRQILEGKEIDIYLPDKNIGIELNGLFWHSTKDKGNKLSLHERNKQARAKHISKQQLAASKSVRLIQFWEDEWLNKLDIVKNIIDASIGTCPVYSARKCKILRLDKCVANEFLNKTHIQGKCDYATDFYGLVHKDTLVAVMGFGISTSIRGNTDSTIWELVRYASIGRVQGGGSRLLKAFETDHRHVKCLVSYCDKRLFTGGSYLQYGFIKKGETGPDYNVVKFSPKMERYHKAWAKKNSLYKRFNLPKDNRTELELTDSLGLARVYDCGKIKFVKEY